MATLIAVDGPAFTGKSSLLIPAIKKSLENQGIEVITSHEPSSTPRGLEIQQKIYASTGQVSQLELARLFNESRRIHLEDVVIPFMESESGKPKVCLLDRYTTSTLVFQGLEGGVPIEKLINMEQQTIHDMVPSLYLVLTFPERNFETILESRRITGEKDTSRNRTVWHSADWEKQLKRHNHYRKLDSIYKSFGINRNIKCLDGSQKPTITMSQALKEVSLSLSENELQGIPEIEFRRSLLKGYMQFVENGGINHIMENWEFQQKLITEKLEGKEKSESIIR